MVNHLKPIKRLLRAVGCKNNSPSDVKSLKQGYRDIDATAPHRKFHVCKKILLRPGRDVQRCQPAGVYRPIKDSFPEASVHMAAILPDKPALVMCVVKVTEGGIERTQDFIFGVEHTVVRLNN